MRIQHNIMAMNAYRNLNNNNNALSGNLEKLSSGYRINRAGDDAAGLAISEKMRAQITGLDVAQDNAQSGINLVQTAEGALTEVHDMLNRMYELAEQSANGTYDDTDRTQLQKEVANLKTEINRIADSANFNGINLLDGNLTAQDLTADGTLQITDKVITAGLDTSAAGVNGSGSKGEYTIDLTGKFGTDDSIKLTFSDSSIGASGTVELKFGTDITGDTIEEQAKSIADKLAGVQGFGNNFSVSVDGSQIKISALTEGASTASLTKVEVTDNGIDGTTFKGDWQTETAGSVGALSGTATLSGGWDNLFNINSDLDTGDTIEIGFTGMNGEALTAKLEVGKDFELGQDVAETTKNIVDALNKAKFEDNEDTITDESTINVGDYFKFNANTSSTGVANSTGSIQVVAGGTLDVDLTVGNIVVTDGDTGVARGPQAPANVNKTPAASISGAVTGSIEFKTPSTTGANFTDGDTITIEGALADGREFSIELVAGKDFEIGDSITGSMDAIYKHLTTSTGTITVGDKEFQIKELFDGGNDTSAIDISQNAGNGSISFGNSGVGTIGVDASGITSIKFKGAGGISADMTSTAGTDPTAATKSFNLKQGLEYGTAITIDGKTYELVQNVMDLSDRRNTAIVVDDINDMQKVADALVNQLNADGAGKFTVTATGDSTNQKLTITTDAKGSNVEAIEVSSAYGDKQAQLSFKFDADKIKDGSYFELNGQRFEFVAEGSDRQVAKDTIALNLKVDKDGKTISTDKELADELAYRIGEAGLANVASDGTISITSRPDENSEVAAPEIKFYEGLTLQIGDTSEDYNQLNVSIQDCHTNSLGIENLDISTQKGAKDALNIIKDSINYVSDVRGTLGATQNRLDHTINNLSVMEENIQDAESNIRDTDVAEEMMEYTKNNILIQSAQAMLAQANQVPQGVLQLLG